MKNEDIAKVCHSVNRVYCQSIGDDSQVPWEEVPESIHKSVLMGVEFHLANDKTPEESHNAWMENRIAEGWVYGEEKNEELKTHPCLVSYENLPAEHKVKDFLFKAVVDSMAEIIDEPVIAAEPVIVHVPEGKTPVKYIGKRERYTDGMYATHIVFLKGETQMVPEDIARKMLKHADVYVPGEIDGAGTPEIVDHVVNDDNLIQDAIDTVNAIRSKQGVKDFVAANFSNMEMGNTNKLIDLKTQAIEFIHQYGVV